VNLDSRYFDQECGAVRIKLSVTASEKEALLVLLREVQNNSEHVLFAFINEQLRDADGVLTDLKVGLDQAQALREILAEATRKQDFPNVNLYCVLDALHRRFDVLEAAST
jgi:hypothetical protein